MVSLELYTEDDSPSFFDTTSVADLDVSAEDRELDGWLEGSDPRRRRREKLLIDCIEPRRRFLLRSFSAIEWLLWVRV